MQWIFQYQLFLFDLDGLLVDTERLHYQAYINMCKRRGFDLNWSFRRYSEASLHDPHALRIQIYEEFPKLKEKEPDWKVLYEEKKQMFMDILEQGAAPLMPGVEELLLALQEANIKRCVVTHSQNQLIAKIREKNPILNTIPNWISREDYTHPKPHPECYQIAIEKWGKADDQMIGFEDSPRGLQALLETKAKPVLICHPDSPYLQPILEKHPNVSYYSSFSEIS